jgi:homeobox-leucine zipper protein
MGLKGCREAVSAELINLNKETEASCSNRSENSSEINLDISRTPPSDGGPMDAPPSHQQQAGNGGGGMIPFYPSVSRAGVDIDQLLHASSVPKMEHHPDTASFGNLLCGVDEPPPFWPWADHQHFN